MKCPRCSSELPPTHSTCPDCGWQPTDLLDETLRNIELINEGTLPGITDVNEAVKSAAYQGTGIAYALVKLGLISPADWLEWPTRFYDAAGIAYKRFEKSVGWSFTVEAEGPEDQPDTDNS
jgi:hypothetical protein